MTTTTTTTTTTTVAGVIARAHHLGYEVVNLRLMDEAEEMGLGLIHISHGGVFVTSLEWEQGEDGEDIPVPSSCTLWVQDEVQSQEAGSLLGWW